MPFTIDNAVPWGRSFDEYRRMFRLSEADLGSAMLGCADGPAGFNAEATKLGCNVTSCDPIYGFSAEAIRRRVVATADAIVAETARNRDEFVWDRFGSVENLRAIRMQAMETFLEDYEFGRSANRYVEAELPLLPFADAQFSLTLCSHFLFLYSEQFSAEFHAQSIRELCRVAGEARIFPLLALGGIRSPHVDVVAEELGREGFDVSVEAVPYEFQRGGNEMMQVVMKRRAAIAADHAIDSFGLED